MTETAADPREAVAIELRRQARYFDQWADQSGLDVNGLDDNTLRTAALSLRARADRLDPPSAGTDR